MANMKTAEGREAWHALKDDTVLAKAVAQYASEAYSRIVEEDDEGVQMADLDNCDVQEDDKDVLIPDSDDPGVKHQSEVPSLQRVSSLYDDAELEPESLELEEAIDDLLMEPDEEPISQKRVSVPVMDEAYPCLLQLLPCLLTFGTDRRD